MNARRSAGSRTLPLAVLAFVATTIAASTSARADETPRPLPPLEALAPRYDAGPVDAGTQVRHTYELRNRGARELQIHVKPGCGCTTTDYDRVIAPGAIGKVAALLDTTLMRGKVEKILTVTTNDPNQPALTLTILAESLLALLVEPDDRPGIRGPARTLQPLVLTVRTPDDSAFAITAVEDEPALRAAVTPLGEAEPGGHRRHQLTVTPSRELPVGAHRPKVTLVTTAPRAARFELHATVMVTGPLVTKPPYLRLGMGMTAASVRVIAADGVPFKLLHGKSTDPDFAVEMVAVRGEPAWDVTVRYTGKPTRHGPLSVMIELTTDAPAQPTVLVRLGGKL